MRFYKGWEMFSNAYCQVVKLIVSAIMCHLHNLIWNTELKTYTQVTNILLNKPAQIVFHE